MTNYPPFFNIDDDLDNLIYYTFEIPNYLKFYDFINAVIHVFNIPFNNFSDSYLIDIISVFKCDNINHMITDFNITHNHHNVLNNKHLERPININSVMDKDKHSIKSKDDKHSIKSKEDKHSKNELIKSQNKNVQNNNAFIELNIENSENYTLDTDLNF
jgi:hypothetical protein